MKIQYIVAISYLLLQHIGITLAKWETIKILIPDTAVEAILDYYGYPDTEVNLKNMFLRVGSVDTLEIESTDFPGACSYCGHIMSKDD